MVQIMRWALAAGATGLLSVPSDVEAEVVQVHKFLAHGNASTTDEWHAQQTQLMGAEGKILGEATGKGKHDAKTKAADKAAVEKLVALLKEWGTAQDARMAVANAHYEATEFAGLAQDLYERRNLGKATEAAVLRRKEYAELPILKDLDPDSKTPLFQQVLDWMQARGMPSPGVHKAEDHTERGKSLKAVKDKVHAMYADLAKAAERADPAVKPQVEKALAAAKAAHNVKDELQALAEVPKLLRGHGM